MRFAKARKMSKVLRLPPKMQLIFWKARTICDTWWNMLRYVVMSQSATAATQNGILTTFETFQNERLCTFPNRHGDAARKSENRDKTCWKPKIRISHGTSSNFHTWQLQNRRLLTSFPNEPQNWLPQNRCFVSGFHQFSSHVKKCTWRSPDKHLQRKSKLSFENLARVSRRTTRNTSKNYHFYNTPNSDLIHAWRSSTPPPPPMPKINI